MSCILLIEGYLYSYQYSVLLYPSY